jgi:hypothetical protein
MQCTELDELVSAYADGQTVPAQSESLEQHVASCSRCRGVLRRQRTTRLLLQGALNDRWVPPDLTLRIAYQLRRRDERGRPARIAAACTVGIAALAVAFGIVVSHGPVQVAAPAVPVVDEIQAPSASGCEACNARLSVRYTMAYGHKVPAALALEVTYDVDANTSGSGHPGRATPAGRPARAVIRSGKPTAKGGETTEALSQRSGGLQAF